MTCPSRSARFLVYLFLGVSFAELIVDSSNACIELESNLCFVETLVWPWTGSRVDGICDFRSPL